MKAGTLGFEDSCDPTFAARRQKRGKDGVARRYSLRPVVHEDDVPDDGSIRDAPANLESSNLGKLAVADIS
jgi:hypothetical protein